MKLSIVIPAYNEEESIEETVLTLYDTLTKFKIDHEIIVVNDSSKDGTKRKLEEIATKINTLVYYTNFGPNGFGNAVKFGLDKFTGDCVAVMMADLSDDPLDLVKYYHRMLVDNLDCVFGSRFIGSDAHRVLYFWHSVANRMLTTASNMFTNLNLTDMETCYKCFKREVIQSIDLQEKRFGIEPELASKVAKGKWRIYEVGISYSGRTYEEGKKIGPKDAFRAIYCVLKYR